MTQAARLPPVVPPPSADADCPREFERFGEGHYCLALDALGLSFEIDRLRRDRAELIGELTVRCTLAGARTVDGVLSVADMNLSSVRARQDRGRYLGTRAHAPDIDWTGLLEELAQRVLTAERQGHPSVSLRDMPRPVPDTTWSVRGFPVLARHPMCVFGDGGAAKSYFALFCAGELARAGHRVGLFDWELAGEDHRERLEALYGADMPDVRYVRCDRPLAHLVDRVRRVVRDDRLDYAIFDSVAFACDGPPEAAEVAGRYFAAVRTLGAIGTLHVAHVAKGQEGSTAHEHRPFGSAFWHNGARAIWFAKLSDSTADGSTITVGFFNRKANLGRVQAPLGFEVTFSDTRTTFTRVDLADVPDLAARLTLTQRLRTVLRAGTATRDALAEEFADEKPETLKRTINRAIQKGLLVEFPGAGGEMRIGIRSKEAP